MQITHKEALFVKKASFKYKHYRICLCVFAALPLCVEKKLQPIYDSFDTM
jgi:hypothetical protein